MVEKVRTGDQVIVLTGKDKGRVGEVLKVILKDRRAIVRGVNIASCHQRQTPTREAGIVSKEKSIHLSNIAIIDKDGRPTRVGFSFINGKKNRIAKRSGDLIDA